MGGCLSYRLRLVRDQVSNQDSLFQNVTRFSYKSLKTATNNFNSNRVIRDNGISISYKGTLKDGSLVIVRVHHNHSNDLLDFSSVIQIMSKVNHHNVVELIGYCNEDDHRMVVHEFVGEYTLDQLLSEPLVEDIVLDWPRRVSICHGIARGLDYLHNGISPRVVLRDVKSSNILVDCSSFNPKIMDFQLSCFLRDSESHCSGSVAGTLGYLAGEYAMTGRYSEKIDIYAFGITLLEIIHGKTIAWFIGEQGETSLVDWTWELRVSGRFLEIVDPTLSEFSENEVRRFADVALSCVQSNSELRPSMSQVRVMLSEGYDSSNIVPTRREVLAIPTYSPPRSIIDELSTYSSQQSSLNDISGNLLNEEDTLFKNVTRFSLKSLKMATNDFNLSREIRWNGFSRSYKGNLDDGSEIVVKVYSTEDKGINFGSMIKIMSGVKHDNVVKLLGYCIEDDHTILVHEFVGDYSLDQLLFSDSKVGDVVLDWPWRVSICHGIACALDYLHNGIAHCVVIRDVKTSSIFLDCSFNPKLVDFEISCLLEEGFSGHYDETYGCLDPEYRTTGRYSDKTDVYGFGIALLEIINGSKMWLFWQDHGKISLIDRALELRESGKILEIVDPTLSEFSEDEVIRFINVALLCVQVPSHLRPSMSEVKLMLFEGYDYSNMVPT